MLKHLKLASFWTFALLLASVALQFVPILGTALLVIGGAGLALVLFLICLALEAAFGRIPRVFALIPLAAVALGFTIYLVQDSEIAKLEAQLRETNPGRVMQFDPDVHDLVTEGAKGFVQAHRIPVAYKESRHHQPQGYLSHRLILEGDCRSIQKDPLHRVMRQWVRGKDQRTSGSGRPTPPRICMLWFPEVPEKPVVRAAVEDRETRTRGLEIRDRVYRIEYEGRNLGEYRTASVYRYHRIPIPVIGCTLVPAAPRLACLARFQGSWEALDAVPADVDQAKFAHPIAIMLGIRKYLPGELDSFAGFAANESALQSARDDKARVDDAAFGVLESLFGDHRVVPDWTLSRSLVRNPERLAGFAEGMVAHLEELLDKPRGAVPTAPVRKDILSKAISALPPETFRSHAQRVFALVSREGLWRSFPALYIRAGVAGETAMPFYRDQLLNRSIAPSLKFLPPLALCRVGTADQAAIAFLKSEFLSVDTLKPHEDAYHQAVFIALVKLGEADFVRRNLDAVKPLYPRWYRAVLSGEGDSVTGPNNCMVRDWPETEYLPPAMASALPK